MLLALDRISVLPGQTLVLHLVNWVEFEDILEEMGEHRHSRIAYYQHQLDIMAPQGKRTHFFTLGKWV